MASAVENASRLKSALGRLGSPAREKAISLSALDPGSPQADRAFVDYCFERRMVDLAIDFAMLNCAMPQADVMTSAQRVTAAAALSWVGQRQLDFSHKLDLTDALRGTFRAIAPLNPADLQSAPDNLVAYPVGLRPQIIKAAAGCPPGTLSLVARATIDPRAGASASLAIAVARPHGRIILSDDGLLTDEADAWSGWMRADGSGAAELRIDLAAPTADLLDLYLISRPDERGGVVEALVTWTAVQATVAISGISAVERRMQLTPIAREVMNAATLLTDASDFPYDVIVPGTSLLTHPLPGRIVLVRLARSVPAGASGVRGVVSVEHADAHPVDFGFWIDAPNADLPSEADLYCARRLQRLDDCSRALRTAPLDRATGLAGGQRNGHLPDRARQRSSGCLLLLGPLARIAGDEYGPPPLKSSERGVDH